ncbi:cytochrome P450 [Nocardia paucivorans]|uniref:cytochrome P450 n=1 Tax=Nocardia paucivorans TaxID=114259 RepID=UPI000592AC4E|nr:cytochrome P450 [Nocardia paucivorans]
MSHVVDAELEFPFTPGPGLELEPEYARLRTHSPVVPVRLPEGTAWLVTRYADVRSIMTDNRFSRARACEPGMPRITTVPPPNAMIISMDPPHHTRIRSIVAREFTVRRVERLREGAEKILAGLLDGVESRGAPADFVSEVAIRFPALVVGDLLGVSESDRDAFREWARDLLSVTSVKPEEGMAALAQLSDYVRGMVEERRRYPTDDLIGALVRAHDDQGKLTDDELVVFGITLLAAGFETTADQMVNSLYVLLTGDRQYDRIRDNPELVPTAVEELVRYIPLGSGSGLPYVATTDVEVGGVTIREGDSVVLSVISANRDPEAFDDADRLDLARNPNPHLGFAHGVHHCLGAQLARMQLQVLFTMLPQRFPNLDLAVAADDVPWKQGMLTRGAERLPITW